MEQGVKLPEYTLLSPVPQGTGKLNLYVDFALDLRSDFNTISPSSILVSLSGKKWYVEPIILKSMSNVFSSQIARWSQGINKEINIQSDLVDNPSSFKRLLLFFHGGRNEIFEKDMPNWLRLADYYQIPLLNDLFNLSSRMIIALKATHINAMNVDEMHTHLIANTTDLLMIEILDNMLQYYPESYVMLWVEADRLNRDELYKQMLSDITVNWETYFRFKVDEGREKVMGLMNNTAVYPYLSYGIIKDIIENSRKSDDEHYIFMNLIDFIRDIILWSNIPDPLPYSSTENRIFISYNYGEKLEPKTRKEAFAILLNNELSPSQIASEIYDGHIELSDITDMEGLPEQYKTKVITSLDYITKENQ